MRNIRRLALILLMAISFQINGQLVLNQPHKFNSALRQANKYFDKQAYQHAAILYQKVLSEQPDFNEAQIRIADCYRMLSDHHNASFWYQQAIKTNQSPGEHWLHLASSLSKQEKFREAIDWYEKYQVQFPEDSRASMYLATLSNLKTLINKRFTLRTMDLHIEGPVFSPTLWNGGLVFVAPGNTGGLMKKVATWNENPYYDLYYAPLKRGKAGFPRYLNSKLNSLYHEGPAVFHNEGSEVIFTRNASSKDSDKSRRLQLLTSRMKPNGHWEEPASLNLNHRDYSVAHPTLNQSESVLYFASDMPGGYGGTDIYKSERKNGAWGKPVNLGPEVNSLGNELFPHFMQGSLYFSSDGRGGLGGLDVFQIDLDQMVEAVNLGFPLNSPQDDFGITWHPEMDHGYISSNRKGVDKIYQFHFKAGN